ncbi:unnamed protein product [Sphagnum balticum]
MELVLVQLPLNTSIVHAHAFQKRNTFITEARLCLQFASIVDYSIEVCGAATDLQEHIIIGNRNSGLESKIFTVACKLKGMAIETKVCIDIWQVFSLLIQMWKVRSHIL